MRKLLLRLVGFHWVESPREVRVTLPGYISDRLAKKILDKTEADLRANASPRGIQRTRRSIIVSL